MPGDEQNSINRAENHASSAIISSNMSLQTTVSHELRRGEDTEVFLLSWRLEAKWVMVALCSFNVVVESALVLVLEGT